MEQGNILKRSIGSIPRPFMENTLTPEIIIGKLFSLYLKAQFFHWQSDTIGRHLLLDELYKALVSLNDEIAEYLLGSQIPKRFESIYVEQPGDFTEQSLMDMINEGVRFSVSLCDYAESRKEEELCNLASELQQAFVKARLFTTYK